VALGPYPLLLCYPQTQLATRRHRSPLPRASNLNSRRKAWGRRGNGRKSSTPTKSAAQPRRKALWPDAGLELTRLPVLGPPRRPRGVPHRPRPRVAEASCGCGVCGDGYVTGAWSNVGVASRPPARLAGAAAAPAAGNEDDAWLVSGAAGSSKFRIRLD